MDDSTAKGWIDVDDMDTIAMLGQQLLSRGLMLSIYYNGQLGWVAETEAENGRCTLGRGATLGAALADALADDACYWTGGRKNRP